ncbi:MAG: hypothetical protein ABI700_13475 [Chloroflexota bacterium]
MAADFKSHVLSRDEKGFGGIPFKRLLLGGVSGGFAYTILRLIAPEVAIPSGVVIAVLSIVLTGPRGGLSLWLRLWLRLRGSLMLRGTQHPGGLRYEFARLLNVPTDLVFLDGAKVFAPPIGLIQLDLREWVTFAQSRDVDRDAGLMFVDAPMAEQAS